MAGLLVNLHDVPKEEEEREGGWTKDGRTGKKKIRRKKEREGGRESEMMKSETVSVQGCQMAKFDSTPSTLVQSKEMNGSDFAT